MGTALLGVCLIVGGTFAYFSDTVSTDNTFGAGTLAMGLSTDTNAEVDFQAENLKPGDTVNRQMTIENEGTLTIGDILLSAEYSVVDSEGNQGEEDFADDLLVTVYNHEAVPVIEQVPLSGLDQMEIAQELAAGETIDYDFEFEFAETDEDQNKFQGQNIDVLFTYEANQQTGGIK